MSSRTCPDWPELMELAPELQFRHYTLARRSCRPTCCRRGAGVDTTTSRSVATSSGTCSTRTTPTPRSPRRCAARTGSRCASSPSAAPARASQRPGRSSGASVLRTAPRGAPPRRAVTTESGMFPSPRTEWASVGADDRNARCERLSRTCAPERSSRSGSPFTSTATPVSSATSRTHSRVERVLGPVVGVGCLGMARGTRAAP